MITSEAKKDFAKARKHVLDIMALHDTFDDAVANFKTATNDGGKENSNSEKQKQNKETSSNWRLRRKIIAYTI